MVVLGGSKRLKVRLIDGLTGAASQVDSPSPIEAMAGETTSVAAPSGVGVKPCVYAQPYQGFW